MHSGRKEIARDREMRGRLRHHAHNVNRPQQFAVICDSPGTDLCGDLVSRVLSRVSDGNQLAVGGLRIFLCVESAEISDSDDGSSDFLHEGAIMPALKLCAVPIGGLI
jgi:hypothetical protein